MGDEETGYIYKRGEEKQKNGRQKERDRHGKEKWSRQRNKREEGYVQKGELDIREKTKREEEGEQKIQESRNVTKEGRGRKYEIRKIARKMGDKKCMEGEKKYRKGKQNEQKIVCKRETRHAGGREGEVKMDSGKKKKIGE